MIEILCLKFPSCLRKKWVKIILIIVFTVVCYWLLWLLRRYMRYRTLEFHFDINESSIWKYYYGANKSYQGRGDCKIPVTPPIPTFFRQNWKSTIKDCSYEKQLAVLENETTLRFLVKTTPPCCIQEIIRGKNDKESGLTDCEYAKGSVNIGTKEALLISCGAYINAEASIPMKPDVQEKVNYWASIPPAEKPPSVFIFGFDSTSRAHAYRSLPQSIDLMMQLGFVDFRFYHSVAHMTLPNLMAFLTGLTIKEVRESCAPTWAKPFDNCPFIWKTFLERKYVTSFMEDGFQSFNWHKKSGFIHKPTDYYLHHFFQQLWKISYDCASTETIPEFMLRYNTRFLQKFAKIPFFSFTWFAYPFHDRLYELPSYDRHLVAVLKMISLNEDLLRDVLIIFVGDHGDRTSSFSHYSDDSFTERGLPPLFVRLPDRFRNLHPEIMETLQSNSEKLTTPFDIHETLLHVLNASSKSGSMLSSFKKRTDRSSLFNDIPENRTCAATNIPNNICLCAINGRFRKRDDVKDTNFTSGVLADAIELLNAKIRNSTYRRQCIVWEPSMSDPVGFHRIISQTYEFVDSVIAFTTLGNKARFEVRVHTLVDGDGTWIGSKLFSFSRISHYGNQSWCVTGDTDEDKVMKELCHCH